LLLTDVGLLQCAGGVHTAEASPTLVVFGFFLTEKIESQGMIRFSLAVKSKPVGF
jgi:hypothetical protein